MPETRCDSAQNRDRCKLLMLCSIGASCGTISVASLAAGVAWRSKPRWQGPLRRTQCQSLPDNENKFTVTASPGIRPVKPGWTAVGPPAAQPVGLSIRGPRPIVNFTRESGPLSLSHTMTAPTRLKIIRGRSPEHSKESHPGRLTGTAAAGARAAGPPGPSVTAWVSPSLPGRVPRRGRPDSRLAAAAPPEARQDNGNSSFFSGPSESESRASHGWYSNSVNLPVPGVPVTPLIIASGPPNRPAGSRRSGKGGARQAVPGDRDLQVAGAVPAAAGRPWVFR
jgi:hypothetical protein